MAAELAEKDQMLATRDVELARLSAITTKLQRLKFGKSSEKLDPDQLALGLDDLDTAIGLAEAAVESLDADAKFEEFLVRLFDHFGVQVEDHGPRSYVLRPGHLITDAFPALPEG